MQPPELPNPDLATHVSKALAEILQRAMQFPVSKQDLDRVRELAAQCGWDISITFVTAWQRLDTQQAMDARIRGLNEALDGIEAGVACFGEPCYCGCHRGNSKVRGFLADVCCRCWMNTPKPEELKGDAVQGLNDAETRWRAEIEAAGKVPTTAAAQIESLEELFRK